MFIYLYRQVHGEDVIYQVFTCVHMMCVPRMYVVLGSSKQITTESIIFTLVPSTAVADLGISKGGFSLTEEIRTVIT